MRFIKEVENEFCKTQIYSFNNKFVLRFESGDLEQIMKFSEQDVLSHEEIEEYLDENFYRKIMEGFEALAKNYDHLMESIDPF